ncbi:1-deoxy-D-xylulose-5-phosphate synthase N-terminal domain-containing protein [Streptomyces sp. NPDC050617]|uniref:1-deoxy-D-xylulose-5-phosphate synthase N-terminal domain-containing protein n=1 Tax=Streptomyces sp. NPDC050617 TaxID=3154628 RepID=UPI00342599BA
MAPDIANIPALFDSPRDAPVFDIGHQAHVHKLPAGRQSGFDFLHQAGGLPFPPTTTPPPSEDV